ncbi:MAG: cell division protein FtsQ/DivIB [Paludibacteraceae bacterium]|nr:cell division protein FtsQ/DivIB [Paludibacteraceae bacterium]
MRRRPNWRNIVFLTLALLLIALSIFFLVRPGGNEDRICHGINVLICDTLNEHFLFEQDIRSHIQKKYPKIIGMQKRDINTAELEKILATDPFIRKAECYIAPSGNLSVKIWQRLPILRVFGNIEPISDIADSIHHHTNTSHSDYYVDEEGRCFPTSKRYNAQVVIVTGNVSRTFVCEKLVPLVRLIRADAFLKDEIQQIDVSSDEELTLIPTYGDHQIVFGKADNYAEKLAKLKLFYEKGLNVIGWGRYESINIDYENQVVCTKKETGDKGR